jgi:MFS family permease
MGGVIAVGYAIGPLIGGALAERVGWQVCTHYDVQTYLTRL